MSLLKPKVNITISNRTVLRITAIVLGVFITLHFVIRLRHVLTLIFVAFFLAMALNPAVSWIARKLKSRSRVWPTAVAYIAVLAILVTFFSLVIPPLARQTSDFISTVPETISNFRTQDSAVARFARRYNVDSQLEEIGRDFSNNIPQLRGKLLSTAGKVGTTLLSILTVLVMTFMMLVEGPRWLDRIWQVYPPKRREHHKQLLGRMYRVVTGYVNGQLIIAVISASFALIALTIASTVYNVSINPIALAGIVAIGALIPMVGNIIAASVVSLVCLFSSLPLAITVAVYFLVYQQIENATIHPYIQARQNELTPLLVFIAALIGITLDGLLGGLVAIPAAGCIKILVEDYINRKKLIPESDED